MKVIKETRELIDLLIHIGFASQRDTNKFLGGYYKSNIFTISHNQMDYTFSMIWHDYNQPFIMFKLSPSIFSTSSASDATNEMKKIFTGILRDKKLNQII